MSIRATLALLSAICLGTAPDKSAAVDILSLPEAIDLALVNNPSYLNDLDFAEMAELDYQSARAIYQTKFRSASATDARSGADVGSTYSLYLSKLDPSGSQYSAGLYNYSFADKNLSEFRISYTLPWFRDPLKDGSFALEQKAMTLTRKKLLADISRQELINQVVASYYELALANESVKLSGLQHAIAQRMQTRAQVRHAGDLITRVELAKHELRLKQARQLRHQALFIQGQAAAAFTATLGLDLGEPVAIGTATLSTIDMSTLPDEVAELEARAVEHRLEVVGSRDDLATLRHKLALASESGATGIDISLQYAWVGESESFADSLEFNDQRFGVGLNMDTDFGSGESRRRQRLLFLQYQTDRRNHAQLLDQVRMEVRKAWFELSRSGDTMEIAADTVYIAEQEYEKSRIRHASGLVDELEVLEAELALEEARFRAFSSRVSYLMAGQALVMASGQLPADPGAQP